jgi:small subunit ribosomal protein S18
MPNDYLAFGRLSLLLPEGGLWSTEMHDTTGIQKRAVGLQPGGRVRARFQGGAPGLTARDEGPARRGGTGYRSSGRRRACPFCQDNIEHLDYKDVQRLRRYLGERAKIEPRRKDHTCARHQRELTAAIKRARHIALLPFVGASARG